MYASTECFVVSITLPNSPDTELKGTTPDGCKYLCKIKIRTDLERKKFVLGTTIVSSGFLFPMVKAKVQ